MADIIGWIGNICFISGACLLARQSVFGFVFNAVANLLYLVMAMALNISSLAIISLILILINIYGIINWIKQKKVI